MFALLLFSVDSTLYNEKRNRRREKPKLVGAAQLLRHKVTGSSNILMTTSAIFIIISRKFDLRKPAHF